MFRGGRRAARVRAATLAAGLAFTSLAAADVSAADQARARDAYERGRIANERGDFARAARELALADAILPDPVTLRVALHAATLADDPVLGQELLERSARGPMDRALSQEVSEARVRFAHRVGRVVVSCGGATPCMAVVDGTEAKPDVPRIVAVGVHTVGVQGAGALEQRMVSVAADETARVQLSGAAAITPTPTPTPARVVMREHPADDPRPSAGWFLAGLSATVAFGVAATVLGVEAGDRHEAFVKDGCQTATPPSTCGSLSRQGKGLQTGMDAFLALTGVAAAGAVTFGVLAFRDDRVPREVVVGLGPGAVTLRASF
jgi:hypothetical protein